MKYESARETLKLGISNVELQNLNLVPNDLMSENEYWYATS